MERIALLLWRLRRVTKFETETMIKAAAYVDKEWKREVDARRQMAGNPAYEEALRDALPQEEWMQQHQANLIIPKEETLERVMRYEAHPSTGLRAGSFDLAQGRLLRPSSGQAPSTQLRAGLHRQLVQTMHELEAMKARRKGEATPLARLDTST